MTQLPPPPHFAGFSRLFGTIKALFIDNKFEWINKDEGKVFDAVPEEESSSTVVVFNLCVQRNSA